MEHQGADRKRARARDRRASHRHCNTAGRDPAQIRKTAAGLFKDTFDDLDGYLRTAERYAVHVDLIIVGPLPDNPDPVGVAPPPW